MSYVQDIVNLEHTQRSYHASKVADASKLVVERLLASVTETISDYDGVTVNVTYNVPRSDPSKVMILARLA